MRYSRRMIREGRRPHGRMLKESRDGWDRDNEIIQQLIDDTLTKVGELKYELENCVRGSYTNCETYTELAEYIRDLGEELSGYYNDIYEIEDEEEEDEEEEDSEDNVRESRKPHGRMLREGLGRDNYAVQFRDMHTAIPYLFTGTKEQMLKVDELLRSIENAESEEDAEILWNELNSLNINDPFEFDSRKVKDDDSYYDWRTETSYKILNGNNRYDLYSAL